MSTPPHIGTQDFYRDLPAVSFGDAADAAVHAELPHDWWVVIADVCGSTEAIAAGAYKDVNTVGVACIAAVANVDRTLALPYLFGGDGATFAIPGELREQVMAALRASQQLARSAFSLRLRAGLVRAGDLHRDGFALRVGKVALSQWVTQPAFFGSGWSEVERRVKTALAQGVTMVDEDGGPALGSFEGFECRWQAVPAFNGHKLALLVAAMDPSADNRALYREVLAQIRCVYGDESQHHPLRAARMQLALTPQLLTHEWRVHVHADRKRPGLAALVRLWCQNIAGRWLFARGRDTATTRWSRYRDDLVMNTDYRKFDGVLRMVIDGSATQAAALEAFLEREYRAGRLVYGVHKSRRALVTCMVRSHNGDHQHFVDGSDGGYAMAARDLKRRMAKLVS